MKKIYLISVLTFLFACEKEKTPTSEYITYEFKIVSAKNHSPLVNYNLEFNQEKWTTYPGVIGKKYSLSTLGFTSTDEEGNASFTIESSVINKPDVEHYFRHHYVESLPFDSTNANFIYSASKIVYNNNKIICVASPNCYLSIKYPIDKAQELNIDSLFLEIPNKKIIKVDIGLNFNVANLECSESVKIKYYYYIKGIKSKEYVKDIFISASNQFSLETVYELAF